MKNSVRKVFDRIEAQRSEILSMYDGLAAEQRRFNPEPGQWNLLQVLRHIITGEKQSFIYIKRKLKIFGEIPKAGLGSKVRHTILHLALLLPIKYKAPKIAEVKEDYPDYESMKEEWERVRTEIKKFIEKSDDELLARALYKHPRAGKMNVKQALMFMETHIAHHQKQIKRIMKSPSFPED